MGGLGEGRKLQLQVGKELKEGKKRRLDKEDVGCRGIQYHILPLSCAPAKNDEHNIYYAERWSPEQGPRPES